MMIELLFIVVVALILVNLYFFYALTKIEDYVNNLDRLQRDKNVAQSNLNGDFIKLFELAHGEIVKNGKKIQAAKDNCKDT